MYKNRRGFFIGSRSARGPPSLSCFVWSERSIEPQLLSAGVNYVVKLIVPLIARHLDPVSRPRLRLTAAQQVKVDVIFICDLSFHGRRREREGEGDEPAA